MKSADELLEEYLALDKEIKEKTKRLDELKDWCRSQGSFATARYVCALQERERTSLAPLDEVMSYIGRDILEKFKLIKRTQFRVIHVSPK